MAIYHFNNRSIYRSSASPLASSAYQSGCKMTSTLRTASYQSGEKLEDFEHAQTYQYGHSERVFATGIELPNSLPEGAREYFSDRCRLWNAVEDVETANNAYLAERVILAFPRELDDAQQLELMEDYAKGLTNQYGVAVDWAIHHDADNNNPHAHILMPARPFADGTDTWSEKQPLSAFSPKKGEKIYICQNERGEQEKVRACEWKAKKDTCKKLYRYYDPEQATYKENGKIDTKKSYYHTLTKEAGDARGFVRANRDPLSLMDDNWKRGKTPAESEREMRRVWERYCNRALEKAGSTERIDARSFAERGINDIPSVHRGVAATNIDKKVFAKLEQASAGRVVKKEDYKAIYISPKKRERYYSDPKQALEARERASQFLKSRRGVSASCAVNVRDAFEAIEREALSQAELSKEQRMAMQATKKLMNIPLELLRAFFDASRCFTCTGAIQEIKSIEGLKHYDLPALQGFPERVKEAEQVRYSAIREIPVEARRDVSQNERAQEFLSRADKAEQWLQQPEYAKDLLQNKLMKSNSISDGRAEIMQSLKTNKISDKMPTASFEVKKQVAEARHKAVDTLCKNIPEPLAQNGTYVKSTIRKIEQASPSLWLEHPQDAHKMLATMPSYEMTAEVLNSCSIETKELLIGERLEQETGAFVRDAEGKYVYQQNTQKFKELQERQKQYMQERRQKTKSISNRAKEYKQKRENADMQQQFKERSEGLEKER